jgi:beta-glucosidase/6-phospho-beta-glucosidase/beta-galactosidase
MLLMQTDLSKQCIFKSFWLAGFESASHINRAGQRLDMLALTQHDIHAEADYALLDSVEICTVRDGIRWHLIEKTPGQYDFSSVLPMVQAANRHNMQVIWNVCHYGWPDDVDVFGPSFVDRFARFCRAVAQFMKDNSAEQPIYIPINEVSFLSWAAGDEAYIYPCAMGRGWELKQNLVRASIAGIEALWDVQPGARIAHVEPLIHTVPPRDRPDLAEAAQCKHNSQFQAFDMLSGRIVPELGGHPRYLDIVGVNYYHANQWEHPNNERLRWEDDPRDERFVPLHSLLMEVYERYQRPMFIGETSHFGVGRGKWLTEIAEEVRTAIDNGVPLAGVCIYPILDRPDWDNLDHWHNSGLWDVMRDERGMLQRVLNTDYAQAFERIRQTQMFLRKVVSD